MPHANRLVILLAIALVAIVIATTTLDGAALWITLGVIGLMLGISLSPRLGRRT